MCKVVKLNGSMAIVCGGPSDHECNEKAFVFGTRDGQELYFDNPKAANQWHNKNYQDTLYASVACSICKKARINDALRGLS